MASAVARGMLPPHAADPAPFSCHGRYDHTLVWLSAYGGMRGPCRSCAPPDPPRGMAGPPRVFLMQACAAVGAV